MLGEFDLINRYFAPLAGPEGLGLVDDAACLMPPPGEDLIVTKDMLVAGVHFRADDAPADIAWKALSVNVSDCVAKGAEPKHYFLALSLPRDTEESWVAGFADGLSAAQQRFGCRLAGGDTTSTPGPLTLSITIVGTVKSGGMIRRAGARAGDDIYVTGTLGDAALGLVCLEQGTPDYPALIERYLRPDPRCGFGKALVGLASSAADISDGLIADMGHIADASGVAAVLRSDLLPLSETARALVAAEPALMDRVWSGGDDYEILFTAAPEARSQIEALATRTGTPVTRIGATRAGAGVQLLDSAGEIVQITRRGYEHF